MFVSFTISVLRIRYCDRHSTVKEQIKEQNPSNFVHLKQVFVLMGTIYDT